MSSYAPETRSSILAAGQGSVWRFDCWEAGRRILDLVLGQSCARCDQEFADDWGDERLCGDCLLSLTPEMPELCWHCGSRQVTAVEGKRDCRRCQGRRLDYSRMICGGMYEGHLRETVLQAKQPKAQPLSAALGGLFARQCASTIDEFAPDMIVPVPLHWRRHWERGFNHTLAMAEGISGRLGIPVRNVLRRRTATLPHRGLSATARRQNIRGAFRVRSLARVSGKRILLLDDIVTTGATCQEAAQVLRRAGAKEVCVGVIARADRPISRPGNRL